MKALRIFRNLVFSSLLLPCILAQASTVTGTVTNKTNGKPSQGDTVVLVDVQQGMSSAGTTRTDARGHYSLEAPGAGAYLVRVEHQGATYFIAAPQGGGAGDIGIYDVAAKVDGIRIDADMILAEAAGGMVRVQERYLVRNTSLPPKAQFSNNTFEFVLPVDAILDGASATRPGGLPTNTRPVPLSSKGHFTINIPIQPDQGEKETLFEVQYHFSYSGKATFAPQLQMATDNLVIYVPKGMTFGGAKGAVFQPAQEDPRVQTFITKNVHPGQAVSFTLSGEGQMPRDPEASSMGQPAGMGTGDSASGDSGNRPGGGIGPPIDAPDPLTKYKWWILGSLALLLAAGVALLLRRKGALATGAQVSGSQVSGSQVSGSQVSTQNKEFPDLQIPVEMHPTAPISRQAAAPTAENAAMLNILKEELFSLEREKISGTISLEEYAVTKAGLEAVLRRTLKNL